MNKKAIKLVILAMALVQMGTNGIAPALAGIAAAFPQVSPSLVQYLMTFPSLVVVVVSLCTSVASRYIPKKYLVAIGCILCGVGSLLAVMMHQSFSVLFVWAGVIGVGIGMIVSMQYGLITDLFEGESRASMMGAATSSSNLGSMIMTLAGGFLATMAWHLNYLVYLIIVPALILSLVCLPKVTVPTEAISNNKTIEQGGKKMGPYVLEAAIFGGIFLFLFNMGPTNLSMLVTEFGLGNATVAGNASTVFLLGGAIMGMLFGRAFRLFRDYILVAGALTMAVGFFIIIHAPNLAVLCIGCFLAGSSISFAMPKCMFTASLGCTPAQATFAMSFVMAIGNLGTFGTPLLTSIAGMVTGSASVTPRFQLAMILALILAVFAGIRAALASAAAKKVSVLD